MRSREMQKFVDGFARDLFGRSQSEAQAASICVMCGHEVGNFRDELSAKEYKISGMCQNCQDEFFGA